MSASNNDYIESVCILHIEAINKVHEMSFIPYFKCFRL